jgi:hypothetical protein
MQAACQATDYLFLIESFPFVGGRVSATEYPQVLKQEPKI